MQNTTTSSFCSGSNKADLPQQSANNDTHKHMTFTIKTKGRLQAVAEHLSQSAFQLEECTEFRPLKPENLTWLRIEFTATDEKGEICICGRPESEHLKKNFSKRRLSVSGILQFDDAESQRRRGTAWYARVRGIDNPDCHPPVIGEVPDKGEYFKAIADLMLRPTLWNMRKPQLVIDVMGTHQELLGADDRTIKKFYEAITKAAERAEAWIVTNGTHTGVPRLVGNACTKARRLGCRITSLGIVSFGVLEDGKSLEIVQQTSPNRYCIHREDERLCVLDPGHDYFLLIDNGTKNVHNEDQNFRTEFLDYLCQVHLKQEEDKGLPYVMLLVGGGFRFIKAVESCVTGEVRNPAILLTGFGGAADLLSYAFTLRHSNEGEQLTDEGFETLIRNNKHFKKMLASMKSNKAPKVLIEKDILSLMASIKVCVENKKLIRAVSVFDDQQMNSLDKQLLEAIFDSEKFDDLRMLALAQQWDRSDIASLILKEAAQQLHKNDRTKVEAMKLMIASIENGQWDFFALLKNYRLIKPDEALTISLMKNQLYLHIYDFLKSSEKMHTKHGRIYRDVARTLEFNCPDLQEQSHYFERTHRRSEIPQREPSSFETLGLKMAKYLPCLLSNPLEENRRTYVQCAIFANSPDTDDLSESDGHVNLRPFYDNYITRYRDLFLLQIMMNHRTFSINVWRDGRELIGTALMASVFLTSLAKKATRKNLTDLANVYKLNAIEWQNRAKGVMEICHRDHPDFTHVILKRRLQTWQDRTVLEVCDYGQLKTFVAQPAVQLTMTQIWHGRLGSTTSPFWIILTAIFPIFLFEMKFLPQQSRRSTIQLLDDDRSDVEEDKWRPYSPSIREPRSWPPALVLLYCTPICRAFVHGAFFLAYLILFTWFILKGQLEPTISPAEIMILAWAFCLLLDVLHESFAQDVRLLLCKNNMQFSQRFKLILREILPRFNVLNRKRADYHFCILPACFFCLLATSVLTRFVVPYEHFTIPKTTYALACFFLWSRTFRFFILSKDMGVIVVTLVQMFPTIICYLLIYLFLLLSFSWPIYALMHPDRTMDQAVIFIELAIKIIYNRFWNLFFIGFEVDKEAVEGTCKNGPAWVRALLSNSSAPSMAASRSSNKGENEDDPNCSQRNIVAIILFMVYIFCTNVAWMNMLIAHLTAIVDKTLDNTITVSQFNYFVGVRRVYHRSYLPTPINFFEYVYGMVRFTYHCCRGANIQAANNDMQENIADSDQDLLDDIERTAADRVLENEIKNEHSDGLQ